MRDITMRAVKTSSRLTRAQVVVLAALTAVVWGSIGATGGYAWYLRSDLCRRRSAAALSDYLDLPASIGAVVPRGLRRREFREIAVYFPDRRGTAFECAAAVLTTTPTPEDPDAYELLLTGGACELSDRTWLREDYRHVLESGLRPSFDAGGPRLVTFAGMDIRFARRQFRLSLQDASGRVAFPSRQRGEASVYCQTFNGHDTGSDVHLTATFAPKDAGIRIDALSVVVPRLPVALLELEQVLGGRVRTGEFAGRLVYSETGPKPELTVSGQCFGIDLAEWTHALPRPWRGRCPELELAECRLVGRGLQRLRFRGVVDPLILGDVAAAWGLHDISGELALAVGRADVGPEGLRAFVASGRCLDVSLESLTRALGWGEMTGNLRVRIDDLTIRDNRLVGLDARIAIDDALERPNHIEGRLVRELVNRAFKVNLPPVLPETIEYTRFGLRLEVRDEELRIFGSHGPREKTILTVRLFEREFPLIPEPEHAIDLSPWLDQLRSRLLPQLRALLNADAQPASDAARDAVRP